MHCLLWLEQIQCHMRIKLKQENKICRYMQTRTRTDQVSKDRT